MQIKYKATKQDYVQFLNWRLKKDIKEKQIAGIVIFSIFVALTVTGKSASWQTITITFILSPIICILLIYLISYFRLLYVLWKSKSTSPNECYSDEKTVSITEEGLTRTYTNTGNTKLFNWNTIVSVYSTETMIYISMVDKSVSIIPKRYFLSDAEIIEFISSVEKRIPEKPIWAKDINKPPYWMGYLCFIPLIGAFVGIVLVFNGIFKYKNKWLTIMGIGGIIFTVAIYSTLFLWGNSTGARKGFEPFAQSDLNILFKEIEFYKLQHGSYPDSLKQLLTKNDFLSINDPVQISFDKTGNTLFNYRKIGNKYYLFSSGIDGIPNTADDIYPQMSTSDTAKFGLILK